MRRDFLLAALLVMAGLVLAGISLVEIAKTNVQLAQATQPLQSSPPAASYSVPAESKPGGERPTTPAPTPARPDAQAQKGGRDTGAAARTRRKDGTADSAEVADEGICPSGARWYARNSQASASATRNPEVRLHLTAL